jgi:hypothetical protein
VKVFQQYNDSEQTGSSCQADDDTACMAIKKTGGSRDSREAVCEMNSKTKNPTGGQGLKNMGLGTWRFKL